MDHMKKIAYLSNVTVDMVVARLKKLYEVYTSGGYDTWIPEVMDDCSPIYGNGIDAVFLILDGTEYYGLSYEETVSKYRLWLSAVQKLVSGVPSYVFVSTVDFNDSQIRSYDEWKDRFKLKSDWYNDLQNIVAGQKNTFVLDLDNRITDIGRNNFYSPKMWYMGSMPYSKIGIEVIVDEIKLAMKAAFEPRRKIAVVDLDNTLWGGIIGEDGVNGIALSKHNEGARYYDFQQRLLEMKQHGVVLSINSKNNEEDVVDVFKHPSMILKRDDFVSVKINWKGKASNIKAIERELNLSEGSFVFIDDNPMERETVKVGCPDVEVLDFPSDTVGLSKFMERAYREYFQLLHTTDEDADKTQMYQAEAKRHNLEASAIDLNSYIETLEMTADIHMMEIKELGRVHQLVNKTNQFNLTTKRYSLKELKEMDADGKSDIFTVHTADKFGDNGLVGVVIVEKEGKEVAIGTFLMSCRVMGRKLEDVVMGCLVNFYKDSFKKMTASYIKTAKNKPVEGLYEQLGFKLVADDGRRKLYSLDLKKDFKYAVPYKSVYFNGRVEN